MLHTTTISSVSGNTAVAPDENASCISTITSLPEIRFADDGGSEMSHMTCGRSVLTGLGASHGARWRGRVRSAGGHESTDVQNGSAPENERPPETPSVWAGVSGVDMTAGVKGAAADAGVDQAAAGDIPRNGCCWGGHVIIPAGAAG